MHSSNKRLRIVALLVAAGALVPATACSSNSAVPYAQIPGNASSQGRLEYNGGASPLDNTSILKKLKKDVVVGSTVDPTNGDTGPYSVSVVQNTYKLKKGQLVVCNFADSAGTAGKGTTIEVLDPAAGSHPSTFAQNADIAGCAGVATSNSNNVYGAGLTGGKVAAFSSGGNLTKAYGTPLVAPFSDADVRCTAALSRCLYSAEYIFASDAHTGGLVSFSINDAGNPNELEVVKGFAVNKKSGWSALGPSGLAYYYPVDTMYVADGVDNAIVGITNTSNLLAKNEVIVNPGGKTFKCKYKGKADPCGVLVKAGAPLRAPVAMTVLPNGNLIAANTQGGSTLVELTPKGTVLATKVLDKSKTPVVFGLAASGTKDSNTVLYYTDTKDNTLHELEQ